MYKKLNRIDYASCNNSQDLFLTTFQNAMVTMVNQGGIIKIVEDYGYLNRGPLLFSLRPDAPARKITRASMELMRYFGDHEYEELNRFMLELQKEMYIAVSAHGRRLHEVEKQYYGRNFSK